MSELSGHYLHLISIYHNEADCSASQPNQLRSRNPSFSSLSTYNYENLWMTYDPHSCDESHHVFAFILY